MIFKLNFFAAFILVAVVFIITGKDIY